MKLRSIGRRDAAASCVLVLAALIAGACASTRTPYGGGPVPPARWHDTQAFGADVNARLAHLEHRVRGDVIKGRLTPSSLDEFAERRRVIEQQLARAGDDGTIDEHERRLIDDGVRSASAVTDPERAQHGARVRAYDLAHWNWETYW